MKTSTGRKQTKQSNTKTTLEFEGIPFEVVRRKVKYSRVEFKPSGLRVVVPRGIDPVRVLHDNKTSILKKYKKLMDQIDTARQMPMIDQGEKEFYEIVNHYIREFSNQLKVEVQQIKYRKMKRRWGSCRSDGIITFNIFLQFVPEHLIAYIIYHELAHLIVRGHNHKFRTIIIKKFPNYRQLDRELNLYGLKLLS